MIIVKLKDQLGNQMFAYAAGKALSIRKGLKLGVQIENSYYNNSEDAKYGNTMASIFPTVAREVVDQIGEGYQIYKELPLEERIGEYWKDLLSVQDDTVIDGHFISCKYFSDHLAEIKESLQLPADIVDEAKRKVQAIKDEACADFTCSVHFRVGKDYQKLGYLMEYGYWVRAARMIKASYPGCKFIVFYDRKTKYVNKFMREFDAAELHGSLVEDMAAVQQTDYHVVCNSTFSIMSALLSDTSTAVIRPSIYFSGIRTLPEDAFPEGWIACKSRRSLVSFASGLLYAVYAKLRKA